VTAVTSGRAAAATRIAGLIAAFVLGLLGAAYYVTWERAPAVSIRWRDSVTPDRRAALERTFGLARGRDPEGRTITYDILDIRSSNIAALLAQPEVEDTGYIDRRTNVVPANAPFGRGGMWIGTRLPVLRIYGVVPAIVVTSLVVLAWALVRTGRHLFSIRSRP
jgi:hypothetical protein